MKKFAISLGRYFAAAILPLTCTTAAVVAQTTTYSTIANFKPYNNDAIGGISRVTFDQAGNLFGISLSGGVYGEGAVYEASPTTDGKWTHKVISSFRYNPPTDIVTVGADQNVYGVASEEGHVGAGAIFRLTRANKGTWKRTDLYSFDDPAGGLYPITGVVFDQSGNLFGVAHSGGEHGNSNYAGGVVFELSPQDDGSWKETVLHSFSSTDGIQSGGLTFDQTGNLYGTTSTCGGSGVAFRLEKPREEGAGWSYTVLHTFSGKRSDGDAVCDISRLTFDNNGNLFGTSAAGGAYDGGSVFEIPAGGKSNGPDTILYSFQATKDGAYDPLGGVVIDDAGNLYGATNRGGPGDNGYGGGKVFELLPQANGSYATRALHNLGTRTFNGVKGADGYSSSGGLTIGPDGRLYGTTNLGGYFAGETENDTGYGTVFRLALSQD